MNNAQGIRRLIGTKDFYKMVLAIAVPIMVQNGITNFVGMLDNIMIGRIGTDPMSGASIVNQLIFIYNLCIFGGVSGAGIFTAQYVGQKDYEGVRATLRFKLWLGLLLTIITVLIFLTCGEALIGLYLQGEGAIENAEATREYGMAYLRIILTGLPAFALGQIYASTLRECRETVLPMKAGLISVVVNLVLNYLLIYGKCGLPALGVQGAALATVIARYVEAFYIILLTHKKQEQYPFAQGLYKTMGVPVGLIKKIIVKGTPLLVNETLWAGAMAVLVQCYSVRGLHVVAALNISNTIGNVFNIVFLALGDSVAIVVGQLLGAGKWEEARDTAWKMISFSVCCCTLVAGVMLLCSGIFPQFYNTSPQVRELAKWLIILTAVFMPQNAFLHASYFTLRSGGKTIITFLFDSAYMWVVSVVLAFCLSRFTTLPILAIFGLVQLADIFKCILGFVLVKKGVWIQNIVQEE